MQQRLGLPRTSGALDFNLGCSGFVYGLALADGLVRTGSAERILLVTAETYTKYIDANDRSLRTIFGDGAAATLIEPDDQPSIYGFQYGTDGSGADTLLVTKGGARNEQHAHKPRHRQRWASDLYMDGPTLISFTVDAVPELIDQVLEKTGLRDEQIDYYLMHQATRKMMVYLQERLEIDWDRLPLALNDCGNTVSSTIPILIDRMRDDGSIQPGTLSMLVAFGVGWSWSGCVWRETWGEA
jgi:3-oxoacyl-[acyl-carrier-protein] synthase-3